MAKLPPELALEPDLPIVDPHHHLWLELPEDTAARQGDENPYNHVRREVPRYLFEELHEDLTCGHNLVATVYAECGSMYRAEGPDAMKPVGEVEFANGVAAIYASGRFGALRACAGIVGYAELLQGACVRDVLEAQIAAGGGRFKGIRNHLTHDPHIPMFAHGNPALMSDPTFREGFAVLGDLGLTYDAWLFEPQIPQLVDLARAFPQVPIVLDHTGAPLGIGHYAGRSDEVFARWKANIAALATCENVFMKLGGLGMPINGFPSFRQSPPASSQQLAEEWRPWFDAAIGAFGASRCMFESNYPTDGGSGSYSVLWNAFKRVCAGASPDEKSALFAGTAARFYGLGLD
ncbi:MAG: amidohydrolase family protein [Novosphingobium sp.]|nr:amidohydrolase family protein [Novosphingobium sp.]